jgi:hypothetical protein
MTMLMSYGMSMLYKQNVHSQMYQFMGTVDVVAAAAAS